jgi:hypothetical protein
MEIGEKRKGKLEAMLEVMLDAAPEGTAGESFIYSSTVTASARLPRRGDYREAVVRFLR